MFVRSAQFPTFQAISIFLQIQLDESNYHIFPPCFIKMKWKIDGSSAHKHERTLQFFTFFQAIYSIYNGSARKKIEPDFLMCACADYNIIIFPGKYVHIYNRVTRRKRIWWLCWFVAARIDHGHILLRLDVNPAQIGTDGATWPWWNLRS